MKTAFPRLRAGLFCASVLATMQSWSPVAVGAKLNAYFHRERHLFDAGTHGYFHYRVPGLVWTDQGTLIAWAEARKEGMIYVLWGKGEGIQHLVLTKFSLEWLTDGRDRLKTENESIDP